MSLAANALDIETELESKRSKHTPRLFAIVVDRIPVILSKHNG